MPAFNLDVFEEENIGGIAITDTVGIQVKEVGEAEEEKEEIQRISDEDKLLSRCTDTEIRSFENLYTHQRLSQATKVPFSTYSQLITFKHLCDYRSEKGPLAKSFFCLLKRNRRNKEIIQW